MIIKHVGIVVKDIKEYLENHVIAEATPVVYDEVQDADICFIAPEGSAVAVELIAPRSEGSRVYNFLKTRGGGLHHVCYGVGSIAEADRIIAEKEMIRVFGPVTAPALGGTSVIFAYTRNRELIEFEIPPAKPSS